MEKGEIILVHGCMKSGKSKHLIENLQQPENKDHEAFKPEIDTRDGDFIRSRAFKGIEIPCKRIGDPRLSLDSTKKIIAFEEFQFFQAEQLIEVVLELKERGKKVFLVGLDLLATGAEWETYTKIRPLADKNIHLKAKCHKCGEPAEFTALLQGAIGEDVQIESSKTVYEPCCREHFEEHLKSLK
jgi:thymidine kinase